MLTIIVRVFDIDDRRPLSGGAGSGEARASVSWRWNGFFINQSVLPQHNIFKYFIGNFASKEMFGKLNFLIFRLQSDFLHSQDLDLDQWIWSAWTSPDSPPARPSQPHSAAACQFNWGNSRNFGLKGNKNDLNALEVFSIFLNVTWLKMLTKVKFSK